MSKTKTEVYCNECYGGSEITMEWMDDRYNISYCVFCGAELDSSDIVEIEEE